MRILIIVFLAIIGASLGSFISVVNERLAKDNKSIIFGRSICPLCRKQLKKIDLIPLLSYIMLKGKCRFCSKKISMIYPALEIFSSLSFIAIYLKFPFVTDTFTLNLQNLTAYLIFALYGIFFTAIFFYDIQHNEVPELFLYGLICITAIGSLILGQPEIKSMGIALLGALIFFGGQHILSKGKWLGDGDVFFSISMAFILGWDNLIIAVASAYCVGASVAIILLLTKKATSKTPVPFTPFLILGTYIAIIFGQQITYWTSTYLIQ